jgi:hypothetical protein
MKATIAAIFIAFILLGCADKKDKSKALLQDVINIHDKVMGADEQLMKNKTQLDTLLKQSQSPAKDTITLLITKLDAADSAMDNWMHNFDPTHTGKTEDETVAYMEGQKKQIMAIDSALNAAIAGSNKYLSKTKGK